MSSVLKIKIDLVCNSGSAKPRPRQPELGVPADDPRLQGAVGVQPPRRRRPHEQPPDHRLHQVSNFSSILVAEFANLKKLASLTNFDP